MIKGIFASLMLVTAFLYKNSDISPEAILDEATNLQNANDRVVGEAEETAEGPSGPSEVSGRCSEGIGSKELTYKHGFFMCMVILGLITLFMK